MTGGPAHAVQFAAKEQAQLAEVESPPDPLGADEVEGPTLATLISPGTELASYQEQARFYRPPTYPHGSGYAAVFQVEAVGPGVASVRPGDVVFAMKPHRSVQRCRQDEVLRVPAGLDPHAATCARMMGICMTTLATTNARPPAIVLVTGLGIVGHLAAKVFDRCGYRVIAVDPLESRRELAARTGLADVRPAVPLDDPAVAGPVALVLECSGNEAAALDGCRVVHKLGEVVLVGVPWTPHTALTAHDLLFEVFYKYAVLRSGWEWEIPRHSDDDGLYEVRAPNDPQSAYQDLLHHRTDRLTICFDWTRHA